MAGQRKAPSRVAETVEEAVTVEAGAGGQPDRPQAVEPAPAAPGPVEQPVKEEPEPRSALCRANAALDQGVAYGSFVWITWPVSDPYMQMLLDQGMLSVLELH